MKTIVVNATALHASGALSILKQFLDAVPNDTYVQYVVFVPSTVEFTVPQSNVRLVPMAVKSFRKRFCWDLFGLKKWLSREEIVPTATLSLQNTGFRTGSKIPNYIYYHQSLPFFNHKWSPFKVQQRPLWFYKCIYPLFVWLYLNKRTEIFVQLEFIKKGFAQKFNFPEEKIHVVAPKIALPTGYSKLQKQLDTNRINLFYPATPFFYKNHKVILDALGQIKNRTFVLYLTCTAQQMVESVPDGVDVRFMGSIPFEQVMAMYTEVDALLFPSYIETYGLPLIEAASTGVSILASDLEYSREVLRGYDGVQFIDYSDVDSWKQAIEHIKKSEKFPPLSLNRGDSWERLFDIVNKSINQ